MKWTDKLALIAITLWVGALWAVGGIAAPTLLISRTCSGE